MSDNINKLKENKVLPLVFSSANITEDKDLPRFKTIEITKLQTDSYLIKKNEKPISKIISLKYINDYYEK